MPPKSGREGKAANKAKAEKVKQAVQDKTFGLKNKNKSKNVQNYVKQMEQSAKAAAARRGVNLDMGGGDPKDSRKAKKEAEERAAKELNDLFAVAIKQPKVPPGVDPKSMVCEYFRVGKCTKGFKCKYSHDLNVERKGGKIDLFTDQRGAGDGDDENMEDWTQEELEKVIADKHAQEKSNATAIICKFFLEAVEKKQYGWFWQCPNGRECKYRHALPPGYVLKSQMKLLLEEEKANKPSIEEQIEEERARVDAKTPITEQTFKGWADRKAQAKRDSEAEKEAARRKKGVLTGREIFAEEGFVAEDDLGASADYTRENDVDAAFAAERAKAHAANEAMRAAQGGAASASAPAQPPQQGGGGGTSASSAAGPSANGSGGAAAAQASAGQVAEEDRQLFEDDDEDEDEDIDDAELDALEHALQTTGL